MSKPTRETNPGTPGTVTTFGAGSAIRRYDEISPPDSSWIGDVCSLVLTLGMIELVTGSFLTIISCFLGWPGR